MVLAGGRIAEAHHAELAALSGARARVDTAARANLDDDVQLFALQRVDHIPDALPNDRTSAPPPEPILSDDHGIGAALQAGNEVPTEVVDSAEQTEPSPPRGAQYEATAVMPPL